MRVLLISSYELGHQPLHVAAPAAALLAASHEVRCVDLAVSSLGDRDTEWAEAIGFSVPMHTAMRIAVATARRVRSQRPDVPTCFYGLYAAVSRDRTIGTVADYAIAGEYQDELVAWVDSLRGGGTVAGDAGLSIVLRRSQARVPARHLLPDLSTYARLAVDGTERLVGYVEASSGCRHRCRHCPIPPVYDGRFRVADIDALLADTAQLVDMGARHLTFGDPDFLNGPPHSLRAIRAVHGAFPDLTYDFTAKVEHILNTPGAIWEELSDSGLLFVVSAFETLNNDILDLLDKGHTASDAADAIHLLRRYQVEIRPSWLPFTPWTQLTDIVDILEFIGHHDLYGNVDPIQLTIRLLIPEGSLIAALPLAAPRLEGYDPDQLTYRWRAADPRVDELQQDLATIVEKGAAAGDDVPTILLDIWGAVLDAVGEEGPLPQIPAGAVTGRPRLTEPWFC